MSENGSNPHEMPGNFGSPPGGPGQYPQAPTPDHGAQQYPQQQYPQQQYPQQQPGQQYPQQQPGQQYPQQYPGQPYQSPGQYAQQPPSGPQQPWGYPPPNQSQPGKSNRTLIGVIGGVVGVALIGGTVYAVQSANSTSPTPRPTVSIGATTGPSAPQPTVPTAKASDAVASYLRALGAGDATTVLSLAATQPTDSTFLTNAVLAKSTAGKIGAISVTDVSDPNATSVQASYTLAGKPVSTQFAVTQVNGEFRLNQVAAEVDLSSLARVPLSVAGTRPESDQLLLFPGVYPVAPANRFYTLGSVNLKVADLEGSTPDARTLALSSAGRSAIIKATKAKYASCLKQNSVKPKGCAIGVRMPSGVKIRTSTISWTTRGGAKWSKMKPKLLTPSLAEAAAPAKVHFYARDARVSGRYWYKDVPITGVRAVISGNKVSVSFY